MDTFWSSREPRRRADMTMYPRALAGAGFLASVFKRGNLFLLGSNVLRFVVNREASMRRHSLFHYLKCALGEPHPGSDYSASVGR